MILGGLQSPKDERDIKLGKIQVESVLPEVYLPDYSDLPDLYQGQQPACGGHAGARGISIFEKKELGSSPKLSPRFVYAVCKTLDGIPDIEGTYGRTVMKVLKDYGIPTDDLFPNKIELGAGEYKDSSKITKEAYDDAKNRAISAYGEVSLSKEAIKQAVYRNGWVLVLKRPWVRNIYPDGHFFVIDGWDKDRLRFANSFGSNWGENGNSWLTDEDLKDLLEAWSSTDQLNTWFTDVLKKKIFILQQMVQLYLKVLDLLKKK